MVDKGLPYAQALFSLAQESGKEDVFLHDFETMQAVFAKNPDLKAILGHPGIFSANKEELLQKIFESELDGKFMDFLKVVCRHHMAGSLLQIADDYGRLLDESRNIQTVRVTSAHPLDDAQKEKLARALEKKLNAGVKLECSVDPGLIAGLKIQTDNAVLDASYLSQLDKMKEQLLKS